MRGGQALASGGQASRGPWEAQPHGGENRQLAQPRRDASARTHGWARMEHMSEAHELENAQAGCMGQRA